MHTLMPMESNGKGVAVASFRSRLASPPPRVEAWRGHSAAFTPTEARRGGLAASSKCNGAEQAPSTPHFPGSGPLFFNISGDSRESSVDGAASPATTTCNELTNRSAAGAAAATASAAPGPAPVGAVPGAADAGASSPFSAGRSCLSRGPRPGRSLPSPSSYLLASSPHSSSSPSLGWELSSPSAHLGAPTLSSSSSCPRLRPLYPASPWGSASDVHVEGRLASLVKQDVGQLEEKLVRQLAVVEQKRGLHWDLTVQRLENKLRQMEQEQQKLFARESTAPKAVNDALEARHATVPFEPKEGTKERLGTDAKRASLSHLAPLRGRMTSGDSELVSLAQPLSSYRQSLGSPLSESDGADEKHSSFGRRLSERVPDHPYRTKMSTARSRVNADPQMIMDDVARMHSTMILAPLMKGEFRSNCSHSFGTVFVFPLPSHTSQDEEDKFGRKFLQRRSQDRPSYASLIKDALISPVLRDKVRIDDCRSLEGARNCVIELVLGFFQNLAEMHNGQCEVFKFTSVAVDELFVCIRMHHQLYEAFAAQNGYPVQLDTSALEELGVSISNFDNVVPAYIQYGYLDHDYLHHYEDRNGRVSVFRQVDIVRLTYDKITDYIDVHALQDLGLLCSFFAAHNTDELIPLKKEWGNLRFLFSIGQPIEEIGDYFGEEIAFYFLFVETMGRGLAALIPFAVLTQIGMILGMQKGLRICFTLVVLFWFMLLVKFWRRKESYYANKWGTDYVKAHMNVKDPINPSFKCKAQPWDLDENQKRLKPDRWKVIVGMSVSIFVSILWIIGVLCLVAINRWKALQYQQAGDKWLFEGATLILTMQIVLLNKVWTFICAWLTDLEQHVTQNTHDRSMAGKTCLMHFIHWFNTFFYLAYVQPSVAPQACPDDIGCKKMLRNQLIIVLCVYTFFAVSDMAVPWIHLKLQMRGEAKRMEKEYKISFLEQEAKMNEYKGAEAAGDYLQIIFPLAWIGLFGTALPVAVILAYVTVMIQMRADAWKLVTVYRRPFPTRVQGIGVWNTVLATLEYVSILNLLGLMMMPDGGVEAAFAVFPICSDGYCDKHRVVIWFCCQNVALLVKLMFDSVVSDTDSRTELEMRRQDLQRTRLHEHTKGDVEDAFEIVCSGDVQNKEEPFEEEPHLDPSHPLFFAPQI